MEERRRHERLAVGDHLFLAIRPEFAKVGPVLDLSRGGVCFEYRAGVGERLSGSLEADLFSNPRQVYLARIPCKVVYVRDVNDAEPAFSGLVARRCGLQFQFSDALQRVQLENLLAERFACSGQ